MPVASALSEARKRGSRLATRPSGSPRKMVKPAIAPRTRIFSVLIAAA